MPRGTLLRNLEFGGPAWLWEQLGYQKRRAAGGSRAGTVLAEDSLFIDIAREWYDFYTDDAIEREVSAYLFPPFWNAVRMYADNGAGSLKWITEALILAGQDDKSIAKQLGPDEDPGTVTVYRRLYFDIERGRESRAWMLKYIWEPGLARDGRLYIYDYFFKATGMYGGLVVLNNILIPALCNPESEKWMYGFLMSERRKQLLNTNGNSAKLPTEMLLPTNEMAASKWLELKEAAHTGAAMSGESLQQLMAAVAQETRIANMESRMGKQEVIDIVKYKDGEL